MKIVNLNKNFANKRVFQDFNCEILDKKVNFIIGESGSGKTTLLKIIAGIDKDYQGDIVKDSDKISVVFQEPRLIPFISTLDNVKLVNEENGKEKAMELLRLVELEDEANSMPNTLSGGMKMRVSIARALNYDREIVLMDEHFSALDEELKGRILPKIFHMLKDKTVIIISHNLADCENYAENIINLNENILKD